MYVYIDVCAYVQHLAPRTLVPSFLTMKKHLLEYLGWGPTVKLASSALNQNRTHTHHDTVTSVSATVRRWTLDNDFNA